jgi:hypothetical protein
MVVRGWGGGGGCLERLSRCYIHREIVQDGAASFLLGDVPSEVDGEEREQTDTEPPLSGHSSYANVSLPEEDLDQVGVPLLCWGSVREN